MFRGVRYSPPANLAAVYPYTDRTISSSYEAVHFGLLSPTPLHSSGIVSGHFYLVTDQHRNNLVIAPLAFLF